MTTAQTIIMTKLHTGAQDYPLLARCVIGSDTRGSRRVTRGDRKPARICTHWLAILARHTAWCRPRAGTRPKNRGTDPL